MGRAKKYVSPILAKKLRATRIQAQLTQREMWELVKIEDVGDRSYISYFESGRLAPSILQFINYHLIANLQTHREITVDEFLNDDTELIF